VRRRVAAAAALAAVLAATAGPARAAGVTLAPVGTADAPVGIIAVPGDSSRLLVVQKDGRIALLHGGRASTWLDLRDRVRSDGYEQGLLGLALAPDYTSSRKVYVYYTAPAPGPGSDLVVSELRGADPATERVLLRIPHRLEQYENGGQLLFGPDGRLWIGTGDGGGEFDAHGNAQRLDPATDDAAQGRDALLGKLLRIDPVPGDGCGGACTIPADNPGFAQREVWAYGLRNPWRFTFDALGGDLILGDVGNHAYEEVDRAAAPVLARGANFGWPLFEGNHPVPGTAPPAGCCMGPVLERAHDDGFDAIIGGVVVRGGGLPSLYGRYLYADAGGGRIRAATLGPQGVVDDRDSGLAAPGLTSFGTDACGRVYVATFGGQILRLTERAGACPATGLGLVVAARQRLGHLRLAVRCATACAVTVRGLFAGAGAGIRTTVARVVLRAGTRAVVTLGVASGARRALAAALRGGRRVTVRIAVAARAPGGVVDRMAATSRLVG
jgi:glucose/arabinose dehydrogenase